MLDFSFETLFRESKTLSLYAKTPHTSFSTCLSLLPLSGLRLNFTLPQLMLSWSVSLVSEACQHHQVGYNSIVTSPTEGSGKGVPGGPSTNTQCYEILSFNQIWSNVILPRFSRTAITRSIKDSRLGCTSVHRWLGWSGHGRVSHQTSLLSTFLHTF